MARWTLRELLWVLLVCLPCILLRLAGWTAAAVLAFHPSVLAYVVWRERGNLRSWFRLSLGDAGLGVGGALLNLGSTAALVFLMEKLGIAPPGGGLDLHSFGLLLVWGGVVAPFTEELYFRGRLLDAVDSRLGRGPGLVLTSLAFAALHSVPVAMPVFFVHGLIYVVLRRWTGSLVAPALAHGLYNLVLLLASA